MRELTRSFFAIVLIGALVLFGLSSWTLAAGSKTIKIGYSGPFTGPTAEYGPNGWRGMLLALDEINEEGINIGGEVHTIEVVRYDSVCTPTEAAANARKMILEDKVVAILGDHCSSCCLAIAPLCDQYKVPGLTIECAADSVTKPGFEYYFRMRAPMGLLAPLTGPGIMKQFSPKRIAFLVINDDYGHAVADSFRDDLATRGVKTVVEESFERGNTDFTIQLTKIKGVNPDMLFYAGSVSECSMLLRQARELGLREDTVFFGDELLAELDFPALAGADTVEGTYALGLWRSVSPEFAKQIKDRFDVPLHYAMTFAYDGLHVFARAIESAQSLDGVKIKDALKKTDYQGLQGHIRFEDFEGYRNQGRLVPCIVKWVNGQRMVVE